MASSYSTDLKLELMVTGENSGTWGDKTNTNLNLLQQAIAGYQSVALTSTNTTLVMTDATISNARNAVIEFTGTITANATVFVASGIEKTYTIKNSTTGAFTLALNQVGGSSVIWGTTEKNIKGVYLDGTNANTIDLSTLGGAINSSASLADFVVGPNELDTSSVTEVKIASSAVTSTKIASFAVTSGALDTASVTSVKIASAAVGPTQLQNTSVTAGSYTVTSLTVDAQGRITSASSGTAGSAGPDIALNVIAPGTGTYTAGPGTTKVWAFIAGGGGGGCGEPNGFVGGPGGKGGFGLFKKDVTLPYSVPYVIGSVGTGQNNQSPAPAGSSSTLNSTDAVANGGGGGQRSPGATGTTGTTGATNRIYDYTPLTYSSMTAGQVFYGTATGPGVVNSSYVDVYAAVQGLGSTVAGFMSSDNSAAGGNRGDGSTTPGGNGGPGRLTIFEVS
jgi:hypothetical protein